MLVETKKAEDILATLDIGGGGTVEKVWDMARYVVAFEQRVRDGQLGLAASRYDGFAQGVAGKLDSMLAPAFSMLIKQGAACAAEGGMKVVMATGILKAIAGAIMSRRGCEPGQPHGADDRGGRVPRLAGRPRRDPQVVRCQKA